MANTTSRKTASKSKRKTVAKSKRKTVAKSKQKTASESKRKVAPKTKPKSSAVKARTRKKASTDFLIEPSSLWNALSKTPGVGVSITDAEGRLLFVNDTTLTLFSDSTEIDYVGKRISDFHPPEFVKERLTMIGDVLKEGRPLAIGHIYKGRNIHSTVWPVVDKTPPYSRVIVVSFTPSLGSVPCELTDSIETFATHYIDLGPLNVLTQRELEVLALLGYGISVPKAAALLHRSPKTIQRHKAAISQKLKLHGQAELVSMVSSLGLEVSHAKLKRFSRQGTPEINDQSSYNPPPQARDNS